jgi:hypothetical protein
VFDMRVVTNQYRRIVPGSEIHILNVRVILPVVLYGCETWFLILREQRRVKVFENRLHKQKNKLHGP